MNLTTESSGPARRLVLIRGAAEPSADDLFDAFRSVVQRAPSGALATVGADGRPAGTVVRVAREPGRWTPMFALPAGCAALEHLERDPRSTILLVDPASASVPQHAARVTLVGRAVRVLRKDTPAARALAGSDDVVLHRLATERVRVSLPGGSRWIDVR